MLTESELIPTDARYDFFYKPRTGFVQHVTSVNEDMLRVPLHALTDPWGLTPTPILFMTEDDPGRVYEVVDFRAATVTVAGLLRPHVQPGTCPPCYLEAAHLVPCRERKVKIFDTACFDAAIGHPALDFDLTAAVQQGYLNPGNAQAILSSPRHGPERVIYFPRAPSAIVPVKMWDPYGVPYIVSEPAYSAAGFAAHPLRDPGVLYLLARRLCVHYGHAALAVAGPMCNTFATGPLLAQAPDKLQELRRVLTARIRHGLAAATWDLSGNENDGYREAFIDMLVGGKVLRVDDSASLANLFLDKLTRIWSLVPIWRGFGTGLPIRGIGYGMLSKSKKYLAEHQAPEEWQHTWSDVQISEFVARLLQRGFSATVTQEEADHLVRDCAPTPILSYCHRQLADGPIEGEAVE
jgi:hypothetical protein